MVPMVGLEPTRLTPPPPQDGVSTNFTTSALRNILIHLLYQPVFQRDLEQVLWSIRHILLRGVLCGCCRWNFRYIRGWCCFICNRCRLNRHLHLCHTPSFNTLCCKIGQSQTGDKKQCRQNGGCPCQKGCGSLTAKYGIGSTAAKGGPDISALAALNQDQPDQDNGN